MISVRSLDLDETTQDLLTLYGIWYVKDVFLFSRKGLSDFLKLDTQVADEIIKKSLEAKAEVESDVAPLYWGFLKRGGLEEATVSTGFDINFEYPRQGVTQLVGEVAATDVMVSKWIEVQGDVLIIDCLAHPLNLEFPLRYSRRRAKSLDEQTLMIDFLVRDVKDYKVHDIVVRGFLHHTSELENNAFDLNQVVKRMATRLERLSQAYSIPVVITTRRRGGSSLSQGVKKMVKVQAEGTLEVHDLQQGTVEYVDSTRP